MTEHRFDTLARKIAGQVSSRRTFLKSAAVGNAAVAATFGGKHLLLGPVGASAQAAQRRAAGQPDIAKLAFDLEYDVNQIFDFVATQIVYEPYRGALRGSVGTLWGRAGNSVDQALLLQALLNEAQITNQLVVGTLGAAEQTELANGVQLSFDDWSTQFIGAVGPDSLGETDAPIAGTPVAATVADLITKAAANVQLLQETVKTQLSEQAALIATELANAKINLPEPSLTPPKSEIDRHAWIQVAHGTDWQDLDPTVPDAVFGTAYATEPEVIAAFDDAECHQVTFRVLGDVIRSGSVTQEEWLTHTAKSMDLVGAPINFFHSKPSSIGASIDAAIGGSDQYGSFLQIGTETTEGQRFAFTGQGGILGALGADSNLEGEPVAEWLEITITSPGEDPIVETRTVFDRIGDAARLAGTVDDVAAKLGPIETYTFEEKDLGPYYLPLVGVLNLAVVSASVPAVYFRQDWSTSDTAGDLAFQNHAFHYVRDGLAHDIAETTGLRFCRDRPTVTGLGFAIVLQDDALASTVSFDLIQATTRAVPLAGAASAIPAGIVEGVLNQTCERNFFEIGANKVAQTVTTEYISVSRVFETASSGGIALATLPAGSEVPADLAAALSASARTQIGKYLSQGFVVIVPTLPVQLGSKPVTGFWAVNPVTGRTIDRMETGGGSELAEEGTLLDVVLEAVHELYVLASCIVGIGVAVGCLLSMVADGYSDGKLAGAVGGAVHGGGFCLGAAL